MREWESQQESEKDGDGGGWEDDEEDGEDGDGEKGDDEVRTMVRRKTARKMVMEWEQWWGERQWERWW